MKEEAVLREGDVAPGFSLMTADDETVALQDAADSGRQVLLVFLRHLG